MAARKSLITGCLLLTFASGASEAAEQSALTTDNPATRSEASQPAQKMRAVRVIEDGERAGGPVVGYVAKRSASGSKTDTPLIETPQSISVITRDRLEDQGVQTLQDALRYTAGVRTDAFGFDNRGDWALVRGVQFMQYQDGLRALFGSYNSARPDPFVLERVEVVRGPASVLYGQGGFGGLVNMVSKRPQADFRGELVAEMGSYDRRQVAGDITGAIDSDATLLYRLIALGRDSGTQVDHVPDDRQLIAPAITWLPGENTSLTVYAHVQDDMSGSSVGFFPWDGTLRPVNGRRIPTDTFISEPGYDEFRTLQKTFGYEFSQGLNDTWTLRQNVRYSDGDVNYKSIYTAFAPAPRLNPDGRTINRTLLHQHNFVESWTADAQLQGNWHAGAFENTVLVGVDYQHVMTGGERGNTTALTNIAPIDVYAPVYGRYVPIAISTVNATTQHQTGVYAQLQSKFDQRWLGVVGVRQDWAKSSTERTPSGKLDTDEHSLRLGLGYLAPQGWMPYVSYSESFLPQAGTNFYGQAYKPQNSEQIEGGIKFQPENQSALYTAAVYEITETNRRVPDPVEPRNNIQVGEARSRGAELEAQAEVAPGLDVVASYAYTDATITRDRPQQQGKRLATVAEHTASVWGRYRFSTGVLAGFSSGLGVRYTGESWDGMDILRTPSVTLLDAMLGYDTGDWRVTLNASNLTDKIHVTTCLNRGDCFYGNRRNVTARVSYLF